MMTTTMTTDDEQWSQPRQQQTGLSPRHQGRRVWRIADISTRSGWRWAPVRSILTGWFATDVVVVVDVVQDRTFRSVVMIGAGVD